MKVQLHVQRGEISKMSAHMNVFYSWNLDHFSLCGSQGCRRLWTLFWLPSTVGRLRLWWKSERSSRGLDELRCLKIDSCPRRRVWGRVFSQGSCSVTSDAAFVSSADGDGFSVWQHVRRRCIHRWGTLLPVERNQREEQVWLNVCCGSEEAGLSY